MGTGRYASSSSSRSAWCRSPQTQGCEVLEVKSGRKISAANLDKIRSVIDILTELADANTPANDDQDDDEQAGPEDDPPADEQADPDDDPDEPDSKGT